MLRRRHIFGGVRCLGDVMAGFTPTNVTASYWFVTRCVGSPRCFARVATMRSNDASGYMSLTRSSDELRRVRTCDAKQRAKQHVLTRDAKQRAKQHAVLRIVRRCVRRVAMGNQRITSTCNQRIVATVAMHAQHVVNGSGTCWVLRNVLV
jgi:hypothetical protein